MPAVTFRNPNSLSSPSVRPHLLLLGSAYSEGPVLSGVTLCQLEFLAASVIPPSGGYESDFPKLFGFYTHSSWSQLPVLFFISYIGSLLGLGGWVILE